MLTLCFHSITSSCCGFVVQLVPTVVQQLKISIGIAASHCPSAVAELLVFITDSLLPLSLSRHILQFFFYTLETCSFIIAKNLELEEAFAFAENEIKDLLVRAIVLHVSGSFQLTFEFLKRVDQHLEGQLGVIASDIAENCAKRPQRSVTVLLVTGC